MVRVGGIVTTDDDTWSDAMIRIWVAAAALLALTVLYTADEAGAQFGDSNADYCHWFLQQHRNTGDEYWWDRWRQCMRGDFWERPGSRPRTQKERLKAQPG